jgi:hypothetical protein
MEAPLPWPVRAAAKTLCICPGDSRRWQRETYFVKNKFITDEHGFTNFKAVLFGLFDPVQISVISGEVWVFV